MSRDNMKEDKKNSSQHAPIRYPCPVEDCKSKPLKDVAAHLYRQHRHLTLETRKSMVLAAQKQTLSPNGDSRGSDVSSDESCSMDRNPVLPTDSVLFIRQ